MDSQSVADEKESSPDFPTSSNASSVSGGVETSIDDGNRDMMIDTDHLHLDLHIDDHHSKCTSTSKSSPRPSGRGSSNSSLSIGQISYHDLSSMQDEFEIIKTLHDGSFSKILLAKQNNPSSGSNNKSLVLKAIPSGGLFTDDFKRELEYNYHLSPHPNIVTSYSISFNWASCLNVYVQEYAPFGDLSKYISRKCLLSSSSSSISPSSSSPLLCLSECQVKLIASQLASALEFMHGFKLVHQDVKAENILVFDSNLSQVKLCDFGSTRREGTLITKGNLISSSSSSILPPETCYLLPQERYECHRSSDVWQVGIFLCVCLTGSLPWKAADFTDPIFRQYTKWLKRKSLKVPEPFKKFTPRLIRLLKRLLEPKDHLRSEIREVFKYLSDDWIESNGRVRKLPVLPVSFYSFWADISMQ